MWGGADSTLGGDPSVPAWTIATFACLKGVGSLTSGPISNALLATGPLKGAGGAFGSTNYVSGVACVSDAVGLALHLHGGDDVW